MKRLFTYCVIFLVCVIGWTFTSCDSEKNIESPYDNYFLKYYGMDGFQVAADMVVDDDGNYFLLGTTSASADLINSADSRIYLVKVDSKGNVINDYILGTPGDVAKDIEALEDGNFIILADHPTTSDNSDIKLIRITSEGEEIDSVVYGSLGNENGKTVTPLSDGGFIVTGATAYDTTILLNPGNPNDLSDIFHYKCDATLQFDDSDWYEQDGPGTFDGGVKSIEVPTLGEYYVFGSSNQFHAGNPEGKTNLYYSSLNAGGIIQNFNFLGDYDENTESAFVDNVPQELGGGYLLVGTKKYNSGAVTLQVTRLATQLSFTSSDEVWDRELPIDAKNLEAVSAAAAYRRSQGFLILANETSSDGRQNIWLSKLDLNGSVKWSRAFGSAEEDDYAAAVMELGDGRILLLGTVNLINGQSKLTLLKLNEQGQLMN
jgi:hypothetical protein